jgi:hypothetical protein
MGHDGIGRRTFLARLGVAAMVSGLRSPQTFAQAAGTEMRGRIGAVIHGYEAQGFHRTGTGVDRISGDWLIDQVREIGVAPMREDFSLSRVDPIDAYLIVNGRKIDGLPFFDGGFTTSAGIRGRLGALNSDAPIGLTEIAPNTAAIGALGDARRQNRHQAIVVVTVALAPDFA